ncbi:hypothetical protein VM1G_11614 [Cytospora mali]|uniref:Uncharacterized protein n=1 Tax=Cytospora mali TaxID=578113 RepID=A0A194W0X2_CYTMA|nr:hypothetical protein VM1G_11614 [Valsa mali]
MSTPRSQQTCPGDHGPSSPSPNIRLLGDEDDNNLNDEALRKRCRGGLLRYIARRLTNRASSVPPPPCPPRVFNWMITSCHFPEEYQADSLRRQTPWFIFFRFLFCELNDIPSCADTWRRCEVHAPNDMEPPLRNARPLNYTNLKWGKRVVFSEQTDDKQWLTGRWLVVAYVWAESREWLQHVNIGRLISFGNASW